MKLGTTFGQNTWAEHSSRTRGPTGPGHSQGQVATPRGQLDAGWTSTPSRRRRQPARPSSSSHRLVAYPLVLPSSPQLVGEGTKCWLTLARGFRPPKVPRPDFRPCEVRVDSRPHGNPISSQTSGILTASVVGRVHPPSGPAAAANAVSARVWAGVPGAGARKRGSESRLPLGYWRVLLEICQQSRPRTLPQHAGIHGSGGSPDSEPPSSEPSCIVSSEDAEP